LISRETSQRDRREVDITLTETGRELIDGVTVRRRKEIANLLTSIPHETQLSVVAALSQLSKAAGEVPEQDWSAGWDL
jgi:DNA-binding MarR family transcriptional regulator